MKLFIDSKGTYLHVKDGMFEIKLDSQIKKSVPVGKIDSILIGKGILISSDAVQLALENNIDIIFLEFDGKPLGRIWHCKLGSTTKIRKSQLIASLNNVGLKYVKEWVTDKIINQAEFLKTLKKHRPEKYEFLTEEILKIENSAEKILKLSGSNILDVAENIRGYEGTAGKIYFSVLSELLATAYKFEKRSQRPAKDQFNAFLNYAYGVLYSRVEKALIIAGLDPYLGFLHRDDYNQLSMVFDFIEPFRIYADEVVFKLFSGKKVNKTHTDLLENGFTLNKDGKVLLMTALNKFLDEDTIRYKGKNQIRGNTILIEAHTFANNLINKKFEIKEIGNYDLLGDV